MVLVPSAYHLISEQFASPLPVSVISPDPHRSPGTNVGAVASHAQSKDATFTGSLSHIVIELVEVIVTS